MNTKLAVLILFILSSCLFSFSQTMRLSESSKISLLTSTASDEEVYTLFGHTSLRVKDDSLQKDFVFNYGVFDFSGDNFIFRFISGKTDYMVRIANYPYYIASYKERGVGVKEQVLNLTQEEKQKIFDALVINTMPENMVYRYNFFYDNCSTRPRDMIENNLDGYIDFPPSIKKQSYRDLVEECMVLSPWTRFGINLVIASPADNIITERQKDFLPAYLSRAFALSNIVDKDGVERKLVSETISLADPQGKALELMHASADAPSAYFINMSDQPLLVGWIVFILALVISYLSYNKRRRTVGVVFDFFLSIIAGLAGCIIFFLMFFSEHPCTSANWNLVWLNPIQLIVAPLFFVKSLSKYVISYHFVNFALLTMFLIGFALVPQQLEISFVPYVLALWIRSGVNIFQNNKKNRKRR